MIARLALAALTAIGAAISGAAAAAADTSDPRIGLVELQLEGRNQDALERVEAALAADPLAARQLGLDYLRGHLLERLGRPSEAHEAFAEAMARLPSLSQHSRYRLAVNQARLGHPEVAAGLLAHVLRGTPPPALVPDAVELFVRLIAAGGDCRLVDDLADGRMPAAERRKIDLTRADCAHRRGDPQAADLYLEILRDELGDEVGRRAAERLDRWLPERAQERDNALLVGRAFHHHRQFDFAIRYLAKALEETLASTAPPADEDTAEALYELARSRFWTGDYLLAASLFGQLASRLDDDRDHARPLYQQARSYELHGNWHLAANSYRLAFNVDPEGDWAGPALLAAMRVEWRLGSEGTALELYELLGSERRWRSLFGRAALFLAASELVRGRPEAVGAWLDDADGSRGASPVEVEFWRGRLAELEGRPDDAVREYLAARSGTPFHPLAREAAARLRQPSLIQPATELARRLASSRTTRNLYGAWLLLGPADPAGRGAREELLRRLATDPRARGFLELSSSPPEAWPLWKARLDQPEEILLGLGVWEQGSQVILKHFPAADAPLALTASRLLADAGETRRSLYIAEILGRRVPAGLPAELLPTELRRVFFPLPFRELIESEAARQGVDPFLLAAVIREESRFDPQALSAASARGLTQFVLPTARQLAGRLGIERLEAEDLHQPAISIALGAAYLAELSQRFGGETHSAIAAYNAGPDQAQLWRSHCYSREAAEFLTKVSFAETRRYLTKVLSSGNQYREIYGGPRSSSQ